MAGQIPDNVRIDPIFVIEATYAPDAAETRPRVRPQHLARIADLMDEGVVIEAGGYLDLSTALLLVRAPNEEAALAILRDDIYMKEGILVEQRVKAFGRVVRVPEPVGQPA
jgi:uncharacterized protein YciI